MSTSARQLLGLEDRIAAEAVASSKQGIRAHQAILHEFNAHLQLIVDQHRSIFDVSPDAALERYNAIVQLRRTIERVVSVHGPSTTEKLRPYRFKGVRKANHMGEGMFVNLPWAWWEARLKPLFLFDTAHPLPPLRSSIGDDGNVGTVHGPDTEDMTPCWEEFIVSHRVTNRVERLGTLLLLSWITESSPAQRAGWKAANPHWDQWVVKVLK